MDVGKYTDLLASHGTPAPKPSPSCESNGSVSTPTGKKNWNHGRPRTSEGEGEIGVARFSRKTGLPRLRGVAVLLGAVVALTGCNGVEKREPLLSRAQTLAELRVVKRGVSVVPPEAAPRAPYPHERLVDGEAVRIAPGGLAWLRRDGGATLLIAGPATLVVRPEQIDVARGKVFVDTEASAPADLKSPTGALHLESVRASVEVADDGAVSAYVLQGGMNTDHGDVKPGELLHIGRDGAVVKTPVTAWDDWTGGLATTDPAALPAPFGMGTVGARKPGQEGQARFPLTVQRLDVRVTIDGDFATTEVDQLFFNPTSDTVEGLYRFRVPGSGVLQRFGVDRAGELVWGRVKEKQAAAAQYRSHVYSGSTEDPALLEWEAPGEYQARLYPIAAGATRRVVTRYAEWLGRQGERGERRVYVYPMAAEGTASTLPHIEELTVDFDLTKAHATDIRVGMLGKQVGNHVVVKGFDVVPRADLALELFDGGKTNATAFRAPHTVDRETTPAEKRAQKEAREEADYVIVPVRPTRAAEPPGGLDLAIVIDSSAATDPGSLSLARSLVGALLAHLGPDDRAAVWAGDATLRPVSEGSDRLAAMDDATRERILTGLARIDRGGASDIGAIVAEAGARLETNRRGAIVYVGDGQPTVGELSTPELRARLARLPAPVRVFAVGVGDRANMALLEGVTRGGIAERVADGHGAAETALHVLEQAERAVWLAPTLDLGPGIDRIFPRQLGALSENETALVVGRIAGTLPRELHLTSATGSLSQPLTVQPLADGGDLRRRWARGRLAQLMEEGAGRAAVVEVGVRCGVVTPFTSLYVPTAEEHARESSPRVAEGDTSKPWWRWPWFPAGLGDQRDLVNEVATAATPVAREGGTGTRAKGEEGSMGSPGNRRYLAQQAAKTDDSAPIARQDALREGMEFGMIGAPPPAAAPAPPKLPEPKLVVRTTVQVEVAAVPGEPLAVIGHEPRPCPASADLPLDERKALWRERIWSGPDRPESLLDVYRDALARCEARTAAERAFLLTLLVERAGTVPVRVELYRLLAHNPTAADVVHRAVLARVTTAADLRKLRDALGIRKADMEAIEKLVRATKTPVERAAVLRDALERWPGDLELAIELLDAYEDAADDARGRALSRRLRQRTDATTLVRTAVGEYYLRLAKKGTGAVAERDRSEARRTFGEIVEFSPEDPGARRRLGDLLRAHGWYEEAYRQYETLARLTPDDASVSLLLAAAAQGMGRIEEAVRWTEKAAGTSDGASPLARTSHALASAYLAWARDEAARSGRKNEATELRKRARRLGPLGASSDGVQVILTWSHPELRPDLWSNSLGAPMPVPDGNPLLGVAEATLSATKSDGMVELRLEPEDAARAARLGADAVLTTIVGEGSEAEKIQRLVVSFEPRAGTGPLIRRFRVDGGNLREEQVL